MRPCKTRVFASRACVWQVGEGAPPAFAHAYTSSSQSPIARATFWLLEHAKEYGPRQTALHVAGASVVCIVAAVGATVAGATLASRAS